MDTQVALKLLELCGMTGQTRCRYILGELYGKRRMGVHMAPHTVIKGKMLLSCRVMAAVTFRNNLHVSRRMTTMTLQADIFMRLSLVGKGENNILMTLHAIRGLNRGMNRSCILLWHSICS